MKAETFWWSFLAVGLIVGGILISDPVPVGIDPIPVGRAMVGVVLMLSGILLATHLLARKKGE